MVSHSLRTWWRSEWQTPQYKISICTSCGRGARRWIERGASPEAALCAAYAIAGYAFPVPVSLFSSDLIVEVISLIPSSSPYPKGGLSHPYFHDNWFPY